MKLKNTMLKVFLLAILTGSASYLSAQALEPVDAVEIDIQVKSLTNDGMLDRLGLLENGADIESQTDSDSDTQRNIIEMYHQYNTTAIAHIRYKAAHAKEIKKWLAQNPNKQRELKALNEEFKKLSAAIRNLLGK